MSDDSQRPIVIKRSKGHGHGHHGGAWKIAYADFVTAMMAFFLLMWLLGSTSKGDLNGISEYFKNPLKVSTGGTGGGAAESHIIKGGGQDLTRQSGQVRKGDNPPDRKKVSLKTAKAELARLDRERLKAVKDKLESLIAATPALAQFKEQLLIDITTEGLRIQIVDEQNRPMFAIGSAQLQPYTRVILREIAAVLNEVPNRISLSGHTDATPYSGGERGYSNWELSADRANASRRELIGGGLEEGKMLRVVGLSSAVPFDRDNPLNPSNRRISIIVMNQETEEAVRRDGGELQVEGADDLKADALGEGEKAAAGDAKDAVPAEEAKDAAPVEGKPAKAS